MTDGPEHFDEPAGSAGPRVLGGRYEVGSLLGRGGMAEVHVARDTRLGRTVAVKLLRPDLARDPSFQTRFRREAQSAASLNHPSIVAVYDTGADPSPQPGGSVVQLPYIVMEYIEGRTLRDTLRAGQPLSLEEALSVTEGVLNALAYSHRAGIVHRDIKPANVMITPAGEVKVMDFGIARTVSDSSATLTATSAVMGTAQYLSPEQARGEDVDARSDLYSTGCLLYEILTGRPPFTGEAPVAVAYQHVSEQPKPPSLLAPGLPPAVDQVVLMALSKDREHRYQSAGDFADDLRRAVEGRPLRGAAIAGAGATAATTVTPAVAAPAEATRAMPAATGATAAYGAAAAAYGAHAASDPSTGSLPPVEDRRSSRRGPVIAIVLLLAAGLAALVYVLTQTGDGGEPDPNQTSATTTTVPELGDTRESAQAALQDAGLRGDFRDVASDDVDSGGIVSVNPQVGASIATGGTVVVEVSTGAAEVPVPDVTNRSQSDARAELANAGLQVGDTQTVDDPNVDQGNVVRTDPAAGSSVARDTQVTLYLSSGQVEMQDLSGKTQQEATDILQGLNLNSTITYETTTDSSDDGVVLDQSVSPGSKVDTGTQVELVVGQLRETSSPSPSPSDGGSGGDGSGGGSDGSGSTPSASSPTPSANGSGSGTDPGTATPEQPGSAAAGSAAGAAAAAGPAGAAGRGVAVGRSGAAGAAGPGHGAPGRG
ncbi:Stk1 family PASTA domain-containing Ser/Thr kinase [Kineococcus gynurae]|uniref:non-specific serine/threonine protein kinase n=1 Tax=Kineococcus gynurae TaxID=452979 RepID=A0ABV5LSU0_9ACTN